MPRKGFGCRRAFASRMVEASVRASWHPRESCGTNCLWDESDQINLIWTYLNESNVAMPMHVLKFCKHSSHLKPFTTNDKQGGLGEQQILAKQQELGKRHVHREARAFVRNPPPSLFALYVSFKPSRQVSKVCSKQTDCPHEVVWFSRYFREI